MALTGEDAREGLTCVLSVKVPDPKFSSRRPRTSSSPPRCARWSRAWSARRCRLVRGEPRRGAQHRRRRSSKPPRPARRPARRANSRGARARSTSPPCPASSPTARNAIPAKSELFLVEGDSAGGSRQAGRATAHSRRCCPCAARSSTSSGRASTRCCRRQEIGTLITALGTGIGRDEFDLAKLRYHKIIIMTDADVDGAHIRTLLLTFFYRQMRTLIEQGHLYIAQPPLYKVGARQVRALPQGRAGARGLSVDEGLEDAVARHRRQRETAAAPICATSSSSARRHATILEGLHRRYTALRRRAGGDRRRARSEGACNDRSRRKPLPPTSPAARRARRGDRARLDRRGPAATAASLLARTVRGVTEAHAARRGAASRSPMRASSTVRAAHLQEVYARPATLKRKEARLTVHGPRDAARRGHGSRPQGPDRSSATRDWAR